MGKAAGLLCEIHNLALVARGAKMGRRPILECPQPGCAYKRVKPRPTPKRQKDLVLTESPLNEHEEQVRLFEEAVDKGKEWPELSLLFAIPNGGFRFTTVAGQMRAEGVKAGVPDVFLPVARRGWHGLFLELKTREGVAQKHQKRWHKALRAQGYRVEIARGWKQAWEILLDYLGNPE